MLVPAQGAGLYRVLTFGFTFRLRWGTSGVRAVRRRAAFGEFRLDRANAPLWRGGADRAGAEAVRGSCPSCRSARSARHQGSRSTRSGPICTSASRARRCREHAALGARRRQAVPNYIETVTRRGYRFDRAGRDPPNRGDRAGGRRGGGFRRGAGRRSTPALEGRAHRGTRYAGQGVATRCVPDSVRSSSSPARPGSARPRSCNDARPDEPQGLACCTARATSCSAPMRPFFR